MKDNIEGSAGEWLRGNPDKKGFYKVTIWTGSEDENEYVELVDFFDGTYWGHAQFVCAYWSEKASVPFNDIQQGGLFIYGVNWIEQIKLCKFGIYGMGIDSNGTVAKIIPPLEEVLPTTLTP